MTEYRAPPRNMKQDQPCHLTLKDATVAIAVDLAKFDAPGQSYIAPRRLVRSHVRQTERTLAFASTPELCALQDLRRQRPDSERRLGRAAGRRDQFIPMCKEEKS